MGLLWLTLAYVITVSISIDIEFPACSHGFTPQGKASSAMFGKHFASLYEGSMVGAGAVNFAVWGYVIAKQEPDRVVGSQVRLNPKLLAAIIGESEPAIQKAIDYLCRADQRSTTKTKDGRRLVKIGEFDYQVVNGAKYRAIRGEETRRDQNRMAQRKLRLKRSLPPVGEKEYEDALERGASEAELDAIVEKHLPK
jgi:hypothetical protein